MTDWQPNKPKSKPPLHNGVLVRLTGGACPTYDVACYTGRDIAGVERWIMADVRLDPAAITHWAIIGEPEDLR